MSQPLRDRELPRTDRFLLRTVRHVVPLTDRAEWLRTWHSELWHLHNTPIHVGRTRTQPTATLALGLTRDAFWLRTERSKRALAGTATLCLGALATMCVAAAGVALLLTGSSREMIAEFAASWQCFLVEAVLVLLVTLATTPRRPIHQPWGTAARLRRQIFFTLKSVLVLLLAFLLSADLCQPLHAALPLAAEILQPLCAAILAIAGLRWAFDDQEARCKHCLLALESPARIGRPSHNLLEWNGTEQVCRQGHGRLNLPEMETSWCRSGQWLDPHQPV